MARSRRTRTGWCRKMRRMPMRRWYALEIALIADGVPKEKVYPLDVARAFKSLDKIKSNGMCVEEGTQPDIMVQSGEINMTPWTRAAPFSLEGQPLGIAFDGEIASHENWVVQKNAPHADAAMVCPRNRPHRRRSSKGEGLSARRRPRFQKPRQDQV